MSALVVLLAALAGAVPAETADPLAGLEADAYQLRPTGFDPRVDHFLGDARFAPIRVNRPLQAYAAGDHPLTIGGTFMWVFGGMAVLGGGLAWSIGGGKWSRAGRDGARVMLIALPVTVGGVAMFDRGMRTQRGNLQPRSKPAETLQGPIYVWADPAVRDEQADTEESDS